MPNNRLVPPGVGAPPMGNPESDTAKVLVPGHDTILIAK